MHAFASSSASPAEPPPPSPQNSKRKRKSDKHKDSKSKDRRQDSSGEEEEGGRPTTAVVSLPMLPFELPPLPEVQVGTHLWLTWLVVLHMTLAVLVEQTRDPFCSLVAMVINVLFLALLLRAKALNDAMDEAVGALRAAQVKLALVMPSGSEKEHLQQLLALSKMSVIVENWEDLGLGLRIHIPFEGTVAINALLLMSVFFFGSGKGRTPCAASHNLSVFFLTQVAGNGQSGGAGARGAARCAAA